MKLVLLLQSLSVVAVFGRAIDEPTDAASVTSDDQRYRFRYKVADETTGDFKSQTEVRDESGVVTGMYKVLQPDGCVRVVHYTADAMGFHPTVTYEGDCQQSGSINPTAEVKSDDSAILKEVSAPINPSSALLSRPVHSAVPGLINPFTTDVQDSAHETQEAFIPRPSQSESDATAATDDAPQEKFIAPLVASISQVPANIATLWQNIGKPFRQEAAAATAAAATGAVPVTSDVKADAAELVVETSPEETKLSEEISNDPVDEVVPVTVFRVEKVETPIEVNNAVPEIVEIVPVAPAAVVSSQSTENTVPESILTLLESFNPDKKEEVDPLQAEASEVRVSRNEPDVSVVVPSAVEYVKESSVEATAVESESRTSDEGTSVPSEEEATVDERSNLSNLAQSLGAVTAPLTQLVQNLQNLTKPVTDLLHGFKKPALLGVSPTTGLPVVPVEAPVTSESPLGKIPTENGEAEQIPAERVVTDHHDQQPSSSIHGIDPVIPDIPAALPEPQQTLTSAADGASLHGEQVMSKEESDGIVVESVPIVQNFESIGVEINDPVVVSAEPVAEEAEPVKIDEPQHSGHIPSSVAETIVSAADPVPAAFVDGPTLKSNPSTVLESAVEQPVEQVVHETSSLTVPVEETVKEADAAPSVETVEDTPTAQSEQYATIVAPGSAAVYSSAPLSTGPFVVRHPETHRADYLGTARSIPASMPYGMRVQTFIPTYTSPALVYSQRRRSHHAAALPYARFAPAAPSTFSKQKQQQRGDYGMRYTAVQTHPPTNSHYAVRPAAPKPTWSPFYSTYVY